MSTRPVREKGDCQRACVTIRKAWRKFKRNVFTMKKPKTVRQKRRAFQYIRYIFKGGRCRRNMLRWMKKYGLLLSVLMLLLLWASFPWLLANFPLSAPKIDFTMAGQSGDMFGSLNTLFSGLAFAGVLLALWMQREDLRLQRKEMKDTREEMKKQTLIQHTQLADERIKYEDERWNRFHREEINEAYKFIDGAYQRCQSFILCHEQCRALEIYRINALQELHEILAGKNTIGEHAFVTLRKLLAACLIRMENYDGNKGEVLSMVEDLNNICNMYTSVTSAYVRAYLYITNKTKYISLVEREELLTDLFSMLTGTASYVLSVSLEGVSYNPFLKDNARNSDEGFLLSTMQGSCPNYVLEAFLHALRGRYRLPRNMNVIADEVECILKKRMQNPSKTEHIS